MSATETKRRQVAILFGALLGISACVPASEARPPAGAGGFTVTPSVGASGAPFSSGVWTVTIKKVIVRATISIQAEDFGIETGGRGGYEQIVFDATKPTQIFAPGVGVGSAKLDFQLSPYFSFEGQDDSYNKDQDVINVSAADVARFGKPADVNPYPSSYSCQGCGMPGPSILLVVQGRLDDRTVTLNVAADVTSSRQGSNETPPPYDGEYHAPGLDIDIRANDLSLGTLDVQPETVFSRVLFGDLVDADDDHDGIITGAELDQHTSASATEGSGKSQTTLMDDLSDALGQVLLTPRVP